MTARTGAFCALLVGLLLSAGGCATTQTLDAFSYRFADNRLEDLEPVIAAIESAPAPTGSPVVVLTTAGETAEVAALDVPTGNVGWRVPLPVRTRPEILGDVVMTSVEEAAVALDLASGRELWRKPLGELDYVGSAREGARLFWVHSIGAGGGATREGTVQAVDARTGRRAWSHTISGTLGKPVAAGGYVLVPWDKQNIAILRQTDGIEVARLRTNDDVIAWIEQRRDGVYYGFRNTYRLGAGSATGNRTDAQVVAHPLPNLPREPEIHEDGFLPVPGRRSARGRIRVYAEPNASSALVGGRAYYVYFRYVFAYDGDGTLRWAAMLDQEVVAGRPLESGLFVVGGNGALLQLDAETGALRFRSDTNLDVASAGLRVDAFEGPTPSEEGAPARDSLATIAGDADNRLVPARAHAVSLLAAMEEPE
ncbi:MAG: PQQ-binding-like beta-propeller repeat protein, partial [Myxococcota bacterium]